MASFSTGYDGEIDDRVRITLGGADVHISESYSVKSSVMHQPCAFSLRLGSSDSAQSIIKQALPGTDFKLYVGDVLRMTGKVDGFEASDDAGAMEVSVFGRDQMSELHDAFINHEKNYVDSTYMGLVETALKELGITDRLVFGDNAAGSSVMTGTKVTRYSEPKPPKTTADIIADNGGQNAGTVVRNVKSKVGERWLHFLRRHLDRAGLFLWCTPEGYYVVNRPNSAQAPVYRIDRVAGQERNRTSVLGGRWRFDTSHRFSEVAIYARGSGRKFGRSKAKGFFDDPEMTGWGYKRPLVLRDSMCQNQEQAEYLAHRKLCEGRRDGYSLQYKMAGHTARSLSDGSRAVWSPDTMVEVHDAILGIDDTFWIESVEMQRSMSGSTTNLTLMRASDLVFGVD